MALTREEVEHIADLARLELTEEEIELYRNQLSAILDYAQSLQCVDTSDIPPTSSVLPARSVLREDTIGVCLTPEQLFLNAPEIESTQFRVPPILE